MNRKLNGLTGLRFLLAIYVVLFHNVDLFKGLEYTYRILSKGYCAVSAFFLLSGFVLAYSHETLQSKIEVKKYFIARFARIYPLYLLALIIELPLFIYYFFKVHPENWVRLVSTIGLANVFMIQSWNKAWLESLNGPGWSLSVEFLFYLSFPVILKFISKINLLGLFTLAAGSYVLIFFDFPMYGTNMFYLFIFGQSAHLSANPLIHLPVFIIGSALGRYYKSGGVATVIEENPWLSYILTCFGALSLSVFLTSGQVEYWNINNGLLVPFFGAIFLGLTCSKNIFTKILSSRLLVALGNASYGIYILQSPIKKWIYLFFNKTNLNQTLGDNLVFIFYLLVLIGLSVVLYFLFEVPVNKKIQALF